MSLPGHFSSGSLSTDPASLACQLMLASPQEHTRASHNILGRIERSLDFLGYHFSAAGLSVAAKTIGNFIEKASRLYEQKCRAASDRAALEMYVSRWARWTTTGRVDSKSTVRKVYRTKCHR
jgi:hypothetical protein